MLKSTVTPNGITKHCQSGGAVLKSTVSPIVTEGYLQSWGVVPKSTMTPVATVGHFQLRGAVLKSTTTPIGIQNYFRYGWVGLKSTMSPVATVGHFQSGGVVLKSTMSPNGSRNKKKFPMWGVVLKSTVSPIGIEGHFQSGVALKSTASPIGTEEHFHSKVVLNHWPIRLTSLQRIRLLRTNITFFGRNFRMCWRRRGSGMNIQETLKSTIVSILSDFQWSQAATSPSEVWQKISSAHLHKRDLKCRFSAQLKHRRTISDTKWRCREVAPPSSLGSLP